MKKSMKLFGIVAGVIAFIVCEGAGIYILANTGFMGGNDALTTGIALYFIGKGFFVGPMLIITTLKK